MKKLITIVLLLAISRVAVADLPSPLAGWNILQDEYDQNHYLDIISYEWEYFTITDEKTGFSSVISYLVSNPRGRLSDVVQLLPDGGNLAIIAQYGQHRPQAEYVNFGLDNYQAGVDDRSFQAEDPDTGYYGRLTPLPFGGPTGENAKLLQGKSTYYEWDLIVTQDWADRAITEDRVITITDIGVLPGEVWNIDVDWPRTKVTGTVVVRETGEILTIDGHGYHDNVWGRYNTVLDGWDTLFFSESTASLLAQGFDANQGVYLTTHIYHKSEQADFTELSFFDNGEPQVIRFFAKDGEMEWIHPHWEWDTLSWQCVPVDGIFVFENDDYFAEVRTDVGRENMGTLLSDETFLVNLFFIDEYFPHFEGRIVNKSTGNTVREFQGRGGGEFAVLKSSRRRPASKFSCNLWGWMRFSNWW